MKNLLLISFFLLTKAVLFGQSSNITLTDCETLFQKNNLDLLAEQYNISASKAAVIQAKIWDQPYLSGELNALNSPNKNILM